MAFRAGVVAVVGKPNVGKSTLVNQIVGQKVSAVSSRSQTTRKPAEGIANVPGGQILFRDTAGIHQPKTKLGKLMVDLAIQTLHDADLILWVIDASKPPDAEDKRLAQLLLDASKTRQPGEPLSLVLAFNKMDRLRPQDVELHYCAYGELAEGAPTMYTNALTGENVEKLVALLLERLPEGAPFFEDEGVYTTQSVRTLTEELIREKAINMTREEIPHVLAVTIEEWTDPSPDDPITRIRAVIFVERASQRPILIGQGARTVKEIGTQARKEIERLLGGKVYLELEVKVGGDWRNSPRKLREMGLA